MVDLPKEESLADLRSLNKFLFDFIDCGLIFDLRCLQKVDLRLQVPELLILLPYDLVFALNLKSVIGLDRIDLLFGLILMLLAQIRLDFCLEIDYLGIEGFL